MDNQVGVPTTDQRPVPAVGDIVLSIDQLHVCIIRFNRLGTLIAAGGINGCIAIVDFSTKFTSNVWNAHALGITNITWTRDGSKLFSSGLDNILVMSDVIAGCVLRRMHIGSYILTATLNPRLNNKFLLYTKFGVKFNDFESNESITIKNKEAFSMLTFDHRGKYIIGGTSKGQIKIFSLDGKLISSSTLDSLQAIRYIHATRRLNLIIVVASDMYIRVYEFDELLKLKKGEMAETINKLYDPTGKTLWHSACASGDADYVAALALTAHEVTIFERATDAIVATLCQSKKEIPLGVEWHPAKPAVASVCNGNIFIWKQRPRPCWAAYAPDFTELGENLVYGEKESEFDKDDEDIPKDDGMGKNLDEDFVDVESVTAPPALCSSDEEDPNKIGGSIFIVNASPAVVPLKSTLPSQMRLKPHFQLPIFREDSFIDEQKSPQQEKDKKDKKKRKKSPLDDNDGDEEDKYPNQNGSIIHNLKESISLEKTNPENKKLFSPLKMAAVVVGSEASGSNEFVALTSTTTIVPRKGSMDDKKPGPTTSNSSPPNKSQSSHQRHKLKRRRREEPSSSLTSSSSSEEDGKGKSISGPKSISKSPYSPIHKPITPLSKTPISPVPMPISEEDEEEEATSSLPNPVIPLTTKNNKLPQSWNLGGQPQPSSSSLQKPLTMPPLPALLPPPPPQPKQVASSAAATSSSSISHSNAIPISSSSSSSADEEKEKEESDSSMENKKEDKNRRRQRRRRSSSTSSSSSSAVNHAWDSD